MKGKHLNEMDAFCLFAHKKIICAFVVLAIALLLVPGIVFATENKGEAPANTKTLTITLTESDKTTPITNSPYVFVAGLNNTLTELT